MSSTPPFYNNSFGNGTEGVDMNSWQQNEFLSRNQQPSMELYMDNSRFYSNNQGTNMNPHQDFSQQRRDSDKSLELNDPSFVSHFPGPPIQTNKACQQGPGN